MSTTIADVAARAGVSTATVSRVLSGSVPVRPETRERVLEVVRELGYRPSPVARSLKLRRTDTLGLIVTDIENPYFPEIVRAVEDAARELGYAVVLCNGADDPVREGSYLDLLAQRRIDGIIIATGGLSERHARWLHDPPVPVVMVNSRPTIAGIGAVLSDNRTGGRLAAEHLLALGHRSLGHLTVPALHAASLPRLAGIRDALAACSINPDELVVAEGDGHVAGGERAMEQLLERAPDTTAVACYNDLTAIGGMRAAKARGLSVPEDLSIVGFDDLDLAAYVDPPLTTVAQEKTVMGRWAVERVVQLIERREPAAAEAAGWAIVELPVRLVVRRSTAPPRAAVTCDRTRGSNEVAKLT